MAKVIMFSKVFPKGHIRAGADTFFPEAIKSANGIDWYGNNFFPKRHTIRSSKRFKVGDKFSPRFWTGKAYRSKQEIICEEMEVKIVYDIDILANGEVWIDGRFYDTIDGVKTVVLANNDGLQISDFKEWFKNLPFSGQIICWNEFINY